MESLESIKIRLKNCEQRIKLLKEFKAPMNLIDNEEQLLQNIKDNLKHRQSD